MNKDELHEILNSEVTYRQTSIEKIEEHYRNKFAKVPHKNGHLFLFNDDRDFLGREHIVSLHKRNAAFTPMHIFNYIVITYVYSGTLTIDVDGDTVNIDEGDIIIFDRHVPHSVKETSAADLGINIVLGENYFSKRFFNHLPNNHRKSKFMHELMNNQNSHSHYLVFKTQNDELTRECIENILCEHFEKSMCSGELIDNFIMILLTQIFRKFEYDTNLNENEFQNMELMSNILDYIVNNFHEGSLKGISNHLGYSPQYTSTLIKQNFGHTFKQLVNTERMKRATILLHNKSIPIYEIAENIGINNLTSFYRRFKDYAGCTPQDYRDKF